LSSVFNSCKAFSKTILLVVLETLFRMMENGLYSISRLRVLLLHLLQVNNGQSEEVVLESLTRFWTRALISWLPNSQYLVVCKIISDFLINKAYVSADYRVKDLCITKLAEFLND
jgi:hypothetical protein